MQYLTNKQSLLDLAHQITSRDSAAAIHQSGADDDRHDGYARRCARTGGGW